MSRKQMIESSFARSIDSYEDHGGLQTQVSARLALMLPQKEVGEVLELGCGTGLFTRRLIERLPASRFLITDFSDDMVRTAENSFRGVPRLAFEVVDGDSLAFARRFDLIASSMALHWFDDPISSLERQRELLTRDGRVVFATLGVDNFAQWKETLASLGMGSGTIVVPKLPGVVFEERITVDYGCAKDFLATMKKTGAAMPRIGYRPISPSALNRVCAEFDRRFGGEVTWHIVYGALES